MYPRHKRNCSEDIITMASPWSSFIRYNSNQPVPQPLHVLSYLLHHNESFMKQQFIQQLHSSFHSRAFLLRSPLIVPIFSSLALFYRPCNVYWVCVRLWTQQMIRKKYCVSRVFWQWEGRKEGSPGKDVLPLLHWVTKRIQRMQIKLRQGRAKEVSWDFESSTERHWRKIRRRRRNSLPVTGALSRVKFCLRWTENCIKDKCILPSTFPLTSAIKQRNSFSFLFYFFASWNRFTGSLLVFTPLQQAGEKRSRRCTREKSFLFYLNSTTRMRTFLHF